MKRAFHEIVFHSFLVLALIGLGLVSRREYGLFVTSILAALAVYVAVYNSPLRWTMPRRRRHIPAFGVCFMGAFLVSFVTRDLGSDSIYHTVVAAAAGAFAFLYTAVKTGTPTHVGIVVNTESVSSHRDPRGTADVTRGERVADTMYALGLFRDKNLVEAKVGVWPEHFEVSQEGSITWYINGQPDMKAVVRFNKKFDPFAEDGGAPSEFRCVVPAVGPGIIAAGPIVRPGRGPYDIEVTPPGGQPKVITVHGGGSQRKG
jgi:hypothetical protein